MQTVRVLILIGTAALAVSTSGAAAKPPSDADVAAVMAPINAVFAGIVARDAAAINAQLVAGGSNTEVIEQSDGSRTIERRGWPEALGGLHPGPEKFEERLINRSIKSDGSVAMLWGDYVFLVNGKVSHCGLDLFDLVREGGVWKIANTTSSQRTKGCPGR
jgi:hypothetical protein